MFEMKDCIIAGVKLIKMPHFKDARGYFTKSFHQSTFRDAALPFVVRESYFSLSHKNTIRGMHFQVPPHEHGKIVFCPQGGITDVVLDLRKQSSTFGKHIVVELNEENQQAIYIPIGCAHGFKANTNNSLTFYLVSSEHQPSSDAGILYDSFGCDWKMTEQPIMSSRDLSFSPFQNFESPF